MTSAQYLRQHIAANGPLSIEQFMEISLSHPEYGYYATQDRFGQQGDFITAPEISQLFGEMMAGLMICLWQLSSQPAPPDLCRLEAGPGRGTLFADMQRVYARLCPELAASTPYFIEASPYLRKQIHNKSEALAPVFITDGSALPACPVFGIAKEFFDALGIRQACFIDGQWFWRAIDFDGDAFHFVAGQPVCEDERINLCLPAQPEAGMIIEYCPSAERHIVLLSQHISRFGGAFILCDYGKSDNLGDSLQAVKNHKKHAILSDIGLSDISHLVDFSALKKQAEHHGARLIGPVEQGKCLMELGIAERAEGLRTKMAPEKDRQLLAALDRLTSPQQMGQIFKIALLVPAGEGLPPGFSTA